MQPKSSKLLITFCLTSLLFTGCERFLKPHKIDIQQGNIVTQEMLRKLELGMNKRQVEYILGTPLVVDTFAPDDWHYLYTIELGSGEFLQRSLQVSFNNGRLTKIVTDYPLPGEQNATDTADLPAKKIIAEETEKLEKRLPNELEDSQHEAGI